jgi:hypothetical protein
VRSGSGPLPWAASGPPQKKQLVPATPKSQNSVQRARATPLRSVILPAWGLKSSWPVPPARASPRALVMQHPGTAACCVPNSRPRCPSPTSGGQDVQSRFDQFPWIHRLSPGLFNILGLNVFFCTGAASLMVPIHFVTVLYTWGDRSKVGTPTGSPARNPGSTPTAFTTRLGG